MKSPSHALNRRNTGSCEKSTQAIVQAASEASAHRYVMALMVTKVPLGDETSPFAQALSLSGALC